jgi:hypothetical protein
MRLALVGLAGAAVMSGCGGGGVDANGFTTGDRKAARNALTALGETSVYDAALKISLTHEHVPNTCVVHIESEKPLTFRMFLTWTPNPEALGDPSGYLRSYTWLDAVIGASGLKGDYSFHQGNELTEKDLKARYGDAFSKPVANCLVLQNRKFGLLPA